MAEAQKILGMIESVDPADTDTLDEIDARFCAFKENATYTSHHHHNKWFGFRVHAKEWNAAATNQPYFTRSRDALKSVRPGGYWFCTYQDATGSRCGMMAKKEAEMASEKVFVNGFPTEELAELHAIVQAIDCGRNCYD